jgi:hypothetical protein
MLSATPYIKTLFQMLKKTTVFLLLITLAFSCSKEDSADRKSFVITDFEKPILDSLVPSTHTAYSTYSIKIKGFSNDTILVYQYDKSLALRLSGQIDSTFKSPHYGNATEFFIFEPFKATKGKITVEYMLM